MCFSFYVCLPHIDLKDFILWLVPPEFAFLFDLEKLSLVGEICAVNFKSRLTYWNLYNWLLCLRERVDDLG